MPGVPTLVNAWLPERDWEAAESADVMTLTSVEGTTVAIAAPDGWQVQNLGDQAILRGDGGAVFVQLYDLDGRDPGAVAARLMRSNRVDDVHTTLDGGTIATADGSLTGDTCVALTDNATGSCAYLSDDDVMVSVIALGSTRESTPAIADVVAPFTREQS